jgi:hypothetical protein
MHVTALRTNRLRPGALLPWALVLTLGLRVAAIEDAVSARDFGFRGLEIYEFKFGTSDLHVRDVSGDGTEDVVFINNRASRLEVLVRRADVDESVRLPAVEATFEDRGFVVDQALTRCRIDDFNGDGRLDILMTGPALGLQLALQVEGGRFDTPQSILIPDAAQVVDLEAADLNADGAPDIVVGRRANAEILWNDGAAKFSRRTRMSYSAADSVGLDTADYDGDGKRDLLFLFASGDLPLRLRLGDGRGGFSMEHAMHIPAARFFRTLEPAAGAATIGCLLQNGTVFRHYSVAKREVAAAFDREEATPRRLPLEGLSSKDPVAWIVAQLVDDSAEDFCVAAPELSQVHIYAGHAGGLRSDPVKIDSLSAIRSLHRNDAGDLIVFSRQEKAIAVHMQGRIDDFPRIVSLPAQPLATTMVPGENAVYCITRRTNAYELARVGLDDKAETRTQVLSIVNDPSDLVAFALGQDATGLLVFMPYQQPRMFRIEGDTVSAMDIAQFRALADVLKPASVALKTAGDGRSLLVSNGRICRRYDWEKETYRAVEQYNPESEGAELAGNCFAALGGRKREPVMYDRSAQELIWFVGEDVKRIKLRGGVPDFSGMAPIRLKRGGPDALVLVGRKDVQLLQDERVAWGLNTIGEYATPADKAALRFLVSVGLSPTADLTVALVDPRNRAIEFVCSAKGALRRVLTMEIYHQPAIGRPTGGGGLEPHALASGDVTGDGLGDLLVLVHDKLIVYPGD